MGDFNSIREKEDRSGCTYAARDCNNFNAFIEDNNLIEVKGSNFQFTWFGPNNKKRKLDRIIINDLWLKSGSWRAISWHKRSSDHSSISLISDNRDWGPKPFRVFNDWLRDEKLQEIMKQVSCVHPRSSWSGTLKELKSEIKEWSHEKKESKKDNIKDQEDKLASMDQLGSNNLERHEVFVQLQEMYHREIIQLKQKARIK